MLDSSNDGASLGQHMNNGPPYLLALVFGLLVSATLYMLFVWPKLEPEEEDDEEEQEARAEVITPGDTPGP